MGQGNGFRRPTAADFNIDPDAGITQAELEEFLRRQKPVPREPNPGGVGEFVSKSTRSVNPYNWAQGVKETATNLPGVASNLAMMPINMAGGAIDATKEGNYGKAGMRMLYGSMPIVGGVVGAAGGLLAGGPPGAVAGGIGGYAYGAGIGSGLDEMGTELERGNYASAAGVGVDTAAQAMLGRIQMHPAAATAPVPAAAQAAQLDRKVGNIAARTIAPTIGRDRYEWGNRAREMGADIFKKTKGWSVDRIQQQMDDLNVRANANLDAAYDLIPPGVRMKTADVKAALEQVMAKYGTRNKDGTWEAFDENKPVFDNLLAARKELDRLPDAMDANTIRDLRQSWDKGAKWEKSGGRYPGWEAVEAKGAAYRQARDTLNEQTKKTFPHLGPQMDETSFAIKATDLLNAFQETESARSKVGRRIMSTTGGVTAGLLQGGPIGGAVGAIAGPAVEFLLTEKLGPGAKIQAARSMAKLADEIRTNGQSPAAMRYAHELALVTQVMGRTGRANQTVESRNATEGVPAPAPAAPAPMSQMQPQAGWFDTVLKGRGQ